MFGNPPNKRQQLHPPQIDQFSKKKATEKARTLKIKHNEKLKDLKMEEGYSGREKNKKSRIRERSSWVSFRCGLEKKGAFKKHRWGPGQWATVLHAREGLKWEGRRGLNAFMEASVLMVSYLSHLLTVNLLANAILFWIVEKAHPLRCQILSSPLPQPF